MCTNSQASQATVPDKRKPPEVGDRRPATDRRQISQTAIAERPRRLPGQGPTDGVGRVARLLNRD